MRVLIVSDQFTRGGLESHIINQVNALRDKVVFVFSFGKYIKNNNLDNLRVDISSTTGYDTSIKGFYDDVINLVNIIRQENIDVIHAHPFHRLASAIIASNITQKPIIYTLHGAPSINVSGGSFTYSFFQRYFFSEMSPDIITVNEHFRSVLENAYLIRKIHYIPNSIQSNLYSNINYDKDGPWALFSRIDPDRIDEIVYIIDNLDRLGISELDIYGTGSRMDEVSSAIKTSGLGSRVSLKGWVEGSSVALKKRNYGGVIGHGQVALEGLSAGLPVLLANTGRVTGLIDKELLSRIAPRNFINNFEADTHIDLIKHQIDSLQSNIGNYNLKDEVVAKYDYLVTSSMYFNILKNSTFTKSNPILDFWKKIEKIIENKEQKHKAQESFFKSREVEDYVCDIFSQSKATINPSLVDLIKFTQSLRLLEQNNLAVKTELDKSVEVIKKQIDLLEKMNLKHILLNTLKRLRDK